MSGLVDRGLLMWGNSTSSPTAVHRKHCNRLWERMERMSKRIGFADVGAKDVSPLQGCGNILAGVSPREARHEIDVNGSGTLCPSISGSEFIHLS